MWKYLMRAAVIVLAAPVLFTTSAVTVVDSTWAQPQPFEPILRPMDACERGDHTESVFDNRCGEVVIDDCPGGDWSINDHDARCGVAPSRDVCPKGDWSGDIRDKGCGTPPPDTCPDGDWTASTTDGKCGTRPKDSCPGGDWTTSRYDNACGTRPQDDCPSGDHTSSRYDGACGTLPPPPPKVAAPQPTKKAVSTPSKPAPTPAPRVVNIHVGVAGSQAEIDSCRGPVLDVVNSGSTSHNTAVAIHNYCGGGQWLGFGVGTRIRFTGLRTGTYVVSGFRTVGTESDGAAALSGTQAVLYTCLWNEVQTRVIMLTKI